MNICTEKENVWCIERIAHLGFLQDADQYYQAFFEALPQARKNVFISAWELESKVNLARVSSEFPSDLRRYFSFLARDNRNLKIKISCWKPGLYLKFSRERLAEYKWRKVSDAGVIYKSERSPYAFGSFHEKIVLVDNACGFLGGMDVSTNRWDTASHEIATDFKEKNEGFYLPIHDVQFIFTGPLLKKTRQMLDQRESNHSAKKKNYPQTKIRLNLSYPHLNNTFGSLSRTDPEAGAYEIEKLYIKAIRLAKKYIYIENQYFTCIPIAEELAKRLKEENGPEVVVILPYSYLGGFERAVYINGRNKIQKILREADKFKRLGIFYPAIPNEQDEQFLKVHSKVMIVDGKFVTLGSANLNYRSMRLDREINLNIEARRVKEKVFIQKIMHSLVCEHLGIQETEFMSNRTLLENIHFFQNLYPRTLKNLEERSLGLSEWLMLFVSPFVDMKKAIPKTIFWSIVTLIMLFLMVSMKMTYEII